MTLQGDTSTSAGPGCECPPMPYGFRGGPLNPNAIYSERELIVGWGFSEARLTRARRDEGLVSEDVGDGQPSYLGAHVLRWLDRERKGEVRRGGDD